MKKLRNEGTIGPVRALCLGGQALVEFALIAPVILLLVVFILDLGRGVFTASTIQQAAEEGARVASAYSSPLPTDADVVGAVRQRMGGSPVTTACLHGPIVAAPPAAGTGQIFITEEPASATVEAAPAPDAPGGSPPTAASGGCSAVVPASSHAALRVTIRFSFQPVTPVVSQFTGTRLVLTAYAVHRTEY